MFVSSFYCYLKYDKNKDFVIDLDNVWIWLGFGQKINAKRVLEKNFIIDKDYINFVLQVDKVKNNNLDIEQNDSSKIKENRGGHNKEIIMLNINTFKKFCLKTYFFFFFYLINNKFNITI